LRFGFGAGEELPHPAFEKRKLDTGVNDIENQNQTIKGDDYLDNQKSLRIVHRIQHIQEAISRCIGVLSAGTAGLR